MVTVVLTNDGAYRDCRELATMSSEVTDTLARIEVPLLTLCSELDCTDFAFQTTYQGGTIPPRAEEAHLVVLKR